MIDSPLKINGFVDGQSHITKDRYMFPFIAFAVKLKIRPLRFLGIDNYTYCVLITNRHILLIY